MASTPWNKLVLFVRRATFGFSESRRWSRNVATGLLLGGALLTATDGVRAEAPSDELQRMRQRLDALEQQNQQLRDLVEDRLGDRPLPAEGTLPVGLRNDRGELDYSRLNHELAPVAPQHHPAEEVGSDLTMTARWNDGLELSTKNKDFRIHIGGRTQFDAAWFSVPDNLDADPVATGLLNRYEDGVDFRRARFRMDGTFYETIDFACEYDWVNAVRVRNAADTGFTDATVPAFTDMWLTFKELPVIGNLRVGNQKEAIGFEHLVSSRFLPFMERSFNQDTFYGGLFNGFTPGIQAFDTWAEEYGTWSLGLYKPTNNVFATATHDRDYAVTGRLTYLPWYVVEGRGLLHVGGSVRHATTVDEQIRFRTRGPVRAGIAPEWPVPADTGTFFADTSTWVNGELVGVYQQWTFQSEYLVSNTSNAEILVAGVPTPVGDVVYHGGYVQVMYYLTPGDYDRYNRKTGVFERVRPVENAFLVGSSCGPLWGTGAWQVGVRYNYLDLNDGAINGGVLHDVTFGVNWFLNPNSKIQFNYAVTDRSNPRPDADGTIHSWGTRVAFDF